MDDLQNKPIEEAKCCSECEQLQDDNGIFRCSWYHGALITDAHEKHCKDSIH